MKPFQKAAAALKCACMPRLHLVGKYDSYYFVRSRLDMKSVVQTDIIASLPDRNYTELLSPDVSVKIPSFHVGAKGLAAAWTFMTLDSLGVWVSSRWNLDFRSASGTFVSSCITFC